MSLARRAREAKEIATAYYDAGADHAAAIAREAYRGLSSLSALGYDDGPPVPSRECCLKRNPPAPARGRSTVASPADRTSETTWRPSLAPVARPLRRALYRLRGSLRPLQRPRIAACGYASLAPHVSVVVSEDGRARLCGLAHCGSVWECPTCRAAIVTKRAGEVKSAVESHGAGRCIMVTLTLRHGAGDDLRKLRANLADAYRALCRGAPWKRFRESVGIVGSIRALELTHGENGWHPHLHVIWLLRDPPRALDVYNTGTDKRPKHEWMFAQRGDFLDRWATMVRRHVGAEFEPDSEHGVSIAPVSRTDYISKLGLELADPGTKRGRAGRTPFEIASDWTSGGARRDAWLWRSYCESMRGARQLTWSKGLKTAFGIVERSDAELTDDEDPQTSDAIVATIPVERWNLLRVLPWAHAYLLEVIETRGAEAFRAALTKTLAVAARKRLEAANHELRLRSRTS